MSLALAHVCTVNNVAMILDVLLQRDLLNPRVLLGHALRAFNVAWSPLLPNVLASSSDDLTVRVWNATSGDCTV